MGGEGRGEEERGEERKRKKSHYFPTPLSRGFLTLTQACLLLYL